MPPCRPPAIALVLAIAGPALVACTARIALKDYPRSRIDRPYTLPAGVDTWTTAATGSYVRDNYGSNTLVPVPWPLNWGLSLSDTWTLELNPVPLAISHELLRTDDHLLGARLSWSLGFGSEGVLLAPSLRMDHRIRLGRTWAWGTAVSGGITRWTNQPSWGWSVGLGTGPIWQVTDTVALQPVVGLGAARTHLLLPGFPLTHVAQVVAPLGMNATFSVARQWDFDASFSYDRIGRENGYAAYSGSVALTHFW